MVTPEPAEPPEREVEVEAVRVFVSSPSDVRPERLVARRILERLDREFGSHFRVEPLLWERQPLRATEHFQDLITPPHAANVVVVVLWARLGTPLPKERFPGPLTGEVVTGTEWEFEDAYAHYREKGAPHIFVYRKRARQVADLDDRNDVETRLVQREHVDAFMRRWLVDEGDGTFKGAFTEFSDTTEFEELLETHLRAWLQDRIQSGTNGAPIRWHRGSPYRGLERFEPEHAQVFFGRRRARNDLRELIERRQAAGPAFVLVLGASGSGKSSLVRAGLIPDLVLPGMVEGIGLCRYAIVKPSDDLQSPIRALAAALQSETALHEIASADDALERTLAALDGDPKPLLAEALDRAAKSAALTERAAARVLVVVDQLEELFTIEGIGAVERTRYIAALEGLARSGLAWVIATMRSDFFGRLDAAPALVHLSEGGRYLLLPPDEHEIDEIVRRPALEAGGRFEENLESGENLAEHIRHAASEHAAALPLLEFVLEQLWQRRSPQRMLTFAAFTAVGGLEGALGTRAEEVFAAQPPDVQRALPTIMRQLATVRSDQAFVVAARTTPVDVFAPGSAERRLVDAFLAPDARLLVAGGDQAGASVRVTHEALFTHWPRAKQEVDAARSDLQLRARLETETASWLQQERSAELLLPAGLRLNQAEDLLRRHPGDLQPTTVEFIELSHVAAEAERTKRQRRRRAMLGAAAVAAMLLLVAAWVANENRRTAADQTRARATEAIRQRLVEGDVAGGVALIGRALTEAASRDPALRALFGYWYPTLTPLPDVLAKRQPRTFFAWHGGSYVVGADRAIERLPDQLILAGVSREGDRLLTFHKGQRMVLWQTAPFEASLAIAFSGGFVPQAIYQPPRSSHLIVVGHGTGLTATSEGPFVLIVDTKGRRIAAERMGDIAVNERCNLLQLDEGGIARLEIGTDGKPVPVSSPAGERWTSMDFEALERTPCERYRISPIVPYDGTSRLDPLAFPNVATESTFWAVTTKAMPDPTPALVPADPHAQQKLAPGRPVRIKVLQDIRQAAPAQQVEVTSTTSPDDTGEDNALFDADRAQFPFEVRGSRHSVLVGNQFANHGVVDATFCARDERGAATTCGVVTTLDMGEEPVVARDGSALFVPSSSLLTGHSLAIVDLDAIEDMTPSVTPPGDGAGSGLTDFNANGDRLATVAEDGIVWVYRRLDRAARVPVPGERPPADGRPRFALTGRIPIPGAGERPEGRRQWSWAGDEDDDTAKAVDPADTGKPASGPLAVAAIRFGGPASLLVLRTDGRLWAVDVDSGGFSWTLPTVGIEGRLAGIVVSRDDRRFAVYSERALRLFSTIGAPLTGAMTLAPDKAAPAKPPTVWFTDAGELVARTRSRTVMRRAALPDTELEAALGNLPLVAGGADLESSTGGLPTSRDHSTLEYTTSGALDW